MTAWWHRPYYDWQRRGSERLLTGAQLVYAALRDVPLDNRSIEQWARRTDSRMFEDAVDRAVEVRHRDTEAQRWVARHVNLADSYLGTGITP